LYNNNNNNNLLKCRLNSTIAYYKASTKTPMKHTNSTTTQSKTLNKQNENNVIGEALYKSSRAKVQNSEKET
jgi:hypothetical protein